MIYVYLTLLILSVLGLLYTFYSLQINRKLNIKKRQFAIRPNRNKFYIIFCINVLLIITFGSLFVYKLLYRPIVPVTPIEELTNKGEPVDKTTPVTILSNNICYKDFDGAKSYRNYYYFNMDGKLYCYDGKTETISFIEEPVDTFILVKDKVIFYYEKQDNGIYTTHLDIYDGRLLRIEKEIIIDERIKDCFGSSSIFLGSYVNIVGESFNAKDIDKIGYVEIDYTYEEQEENEEPKVEKQEKEKVFIKDILSPQYHNYDRVVIHLQYSFSSETIKTSAICLSDYYMTMIDGYMYFFCNTYEKDHYNNESFILKYNPYNLAISDYHLYSNIIYSSPIIHNEGITTYISFVTYNSSYSNYQELYISGDLDIIEMNDTYIDTKERDYDSIKKNQLILNNKIISINNVLYYDNNLLINYEMDDKKVIINEYDLYEKIVNKYCVSFESDFINCLVKDIKSYKDDYFAIFEVDDKEMIVKIPKYQEKEEDSTIRKDNEVLEHIIEVEANELTSDDYFIVNNSLLTIKENINNEKEINIVKLDDLFKEEGEE